MLNEVHQAEKKITWKFGSTQRNRPCKSWWILGKIF